jgi:hypothetical protein
MVVFASLEAGWGKVITLASARVDVIDLDHATMSAASPP